MNESNLRGSERRFWSEHFIAWSLVAGFVVLLSSIIFGSCYLIGVITLFLVGATFIPPVFVIFKLGLFVLFVFACVWFVVGLVSEVLNIWRDESNYG